MQWRVLMPMVVLATGLVLGAGGCRKAESGPVVLHVYAPCGMEMPFMELETLFEQAHPGVDVNLLLDNAHILTERVLDNGERPDVIASPGGHELARLTEAGLLKTADIHPFSQLDLCLFVPRANRAAVTSMDDLAKDDVKVLAVADPDKTSIGHFTVQALQKAGLWERVKGKVVITGDASQTYKHVAGEKADASFAYRSCPLKTAPDKLEYSKVRVIQSVPGELYGPAYATVAIVGSTSHRDLADAFVQLVLSDAGKQIMAKYDLPCLAEAAKGPQKETKP